jgi:predicted Zn finger-like uncharacterized protein
VTNTAPAFTVYCPSCSTGFPIDPAKVPLAGVHAICSACLRVFQVLAPAGAAEPWGEASEPGGVAPPLWEVADEAGTDFGSTVAAPEEALEEATSLSPDTVAEESAPPVQSAGHRGDPSVASGAERFGHRDPHERARHLARVLVSDIIAYYPVKYRESFDRGTLQEDFRSEVERSWKEYVDQVGLETAEGTSFFKDALNQVLGKGRHIF